MSNNEIKTREQLERDRNILFQMANNYAGNVYGDIAVSLHGVCNQLLLEIENPQAGFSVAPADELPGCRCTCGGCNNG